MIEIYVEQISERLIYTLDFVFKERGLDYKLNNDFLSFVNSTHSKLNYSEQTFKGILQLIPSVVLFDESVFVYGIEKSKFEREECLSFNRVIDPLASVFYVLSRMEEYTNYREDNHGRFAAKYSLQYEFGWLDKAMCDRWAIDFIYFLEKHTDFKHNLKIEKVKIKPTFDIDNTFAYQWKQGFRKWYSISKDRLTNNKKRLTERRKVLSLQMKDPYDTFEYIESIADRGYEVNVFWLLGDLAKYDKNISYSDSRHQQLISRIGEKAIVGLHPSYKSNTYEFQLNEEKMRLKNILDTEIECSRQHFLKLKVGLTYPNLIALGFKDDFSMGFADQVGFRNGTARPYYWFDLNKNQISELIIHPFVYMDGTLNEYLKLSIDESKNIIWKLYGEVSRFGGDFSFIWHNETIGNYGKWKGWSDVLEFTLNLNKNK